jgi:adenine C2-methylase RlmN of 23S rRNA A2503 and tRNA A37
LNDLSSINENVYIFSEQKINDSNFYYRQSFHFIQEFFEIYHPYHQINRLYQLKEFEVKYISHVFYYETSILKKFVKCIKKPSISNLFKTMLYYCRKSNKYVSIMYFLMEEIFQDLACFEKLKPIITSLNDNYELLFEQYLSRFDYFDTQYMNKFVENMLLIYRYQS